MAARANELAQRILDEHQSSPLPDAAEEAVADVLRRRAES